MNNLDKQYQNLLKDIMTNGVKKGDRTGTGTISVFGRQIRHNMSEGFPLLTTKKMAIKTMMTELKWFLKGDTNIKYLVENGCNIWNGDAYKNYLKKVDVDSISKDFGIPAVHHTMEEFIKRIKTDDTFAEDFGELGPIYGRQWREWKTQVAVPTTLTIDDGDDSEPLFVRGTRYIDQIENLINDLKTNPDSRRLMVNAWNVGELNNMVLPPCHYGFQCYVADGKLSLMWNQRSVDTFLGLPFNIASYGTLLLLLCQETGYEPGELVGNLGDVHLYSNHIDQANEQCGRQPYKLPTIELSNVSVLDGEFDYEIIGYESHPTIKAPLSN
jgi:thymidylate synthase